MKNAMPVTKDKPKADFGLPSLRASNRGTKAIQARNPRLNLGKERISSRAERRAKSTPSIIRNRICLVLPHGPANLFLYEIRIKGKRATNNRSAARNLCMFLLKFVPHSHEAHQRLTSLRCFYWTNLRKPRRSPATAK